ncbi:MAG: hypothetical protein ACI9AR_000460 [Flavobacteriaceae bacterium]|jgi:hypothetical protein
MENTELEDIFSFGEMPMDIYMNGVITNCPKNIKRWWQSDLFANIIIGTLLTVIASMILFVVYYSK